MKDTISAIAFFFGMLVVGAVMIALFVNPAHSFSWESADKHEVTKAWETPIAEYEDAQSPYADRTEVDQPQPGWYQSPNDFPVPDGWPDWVKRQWFDLIGETPIRYEYLTRWTTLPIRSNTKWVDIRATREKGSIKLEAPGEWGYFTFFVADPPYLTIEQDFNGHAILYNADDSLQYRVRCFTENGYLGEYVTAQQTQFIEKARYPEVNDMYQFSWSYTNHMRAWRVVEDEGRSYWVLWRNYVPTAIPTYAAFLTVLGLDGEAKKHLGPVYDRWYNLEPVYGDLGVDGRAVISAVGCNSYIQSGDAGKASRDNKDPRWRTTFESYQSVSITPRLDENGYIFGTVFSNNRALVKVNIGGVAEAWGNGGQDCDDENDYPELMARCFFNSQAYRLLTDHKNSQYISLGLNAAESFRFETLDAIDATPGATEGDLNWGLDWTGTAPYSWFGYAKDICINGDYLYIAGWHGSQSMIAKVGLATGDRVWEKSLESGVSLYSVKTCPENKGLVCAGTYWDGVSNWLRLVKLSLEGEIEWSKSFRPPGLDAYGFDAIETSDTGYLAVGYMKDSSNKQSNYYVKTNRYGESCSQGTPCR